MIGHNVLFDWEHGRVGFAKSNCEYPDEKEEETAVAETIEPASSNCALAEATLSESCLENVDLDQCLQNPVRPNNFPAVVSLFIFFSIYLTLSFLSVT
jgi:hypothetical protein